MNYISLGKRIYNCCRWINYRFLVVFWLRCIFHPHEVRHLHDFLQANRLRQRIFAVNPQFFGCSTTRLARPCILAVIRGQRMG